jgi:ubiquinone/menaquinone biosynthesis C-methylase UbiE
MSDGQEVGQVYDGLAETYDGVHVDAKSLAENAYVSKQLRALVRHGDRVADLGCGTGLMLELCPVDAEHYVGLDVSAKMLARAQEKFPRHAFHRADIQEPHPALPEGSLDVVVSLFGSPAYCDPERVKAQVWRMLKPGGRYFLMFCGARYPRRSTYVSRHLDLMTTRTAAELRRVFHPAVVRGMSGAVDALPARAPLSLASGLLRLESVTLGQLAPDLFFFLNVSGQRPAAG